MNKTQKLINDVLSEHKANEIINLDIKKLTDMADAMIIASGTSTRHIKSLAKYILEALRENNVSILSVEGEHDSNWVLIDLGDIIIHLMLPEAREFYELEKLWSKKPRVGTNRPK